MSLRGLKGRVTRLEKKTKATGFQLDWTCLLEVPANLGDESPPTEITDEMVAADRTGWLRVFQESDRSPPVEDACDRILAGWMAELATLPDVNPEARRM